MLVATDHLSHAVVEFEHALVYFFVKQYTCFGQLDAAVDAVEQARAQLLFQTLDLLADCGLRGAQFNRRRRETALPRGDFEYPQYVQRYPAQGFKHKLS